jgi:hypothetical protein
MNYRMAGHVVKKVPPCPVLISHKPALLGASTQQLRATNRMKPTGLAPLWLAAACVAFAISSTFAMAADDAAKGPAGGLAAQPAIKGIVVVNLTKAGATDDRFREKRAAWPKALTSTIWVGAPPTKDNLGPFNAFNNALATFAAKATLDNEIALLATLTKLQAATDETRIISKAFDQILLILFADVTDEQPPVAVIKETKRLTRLAQDIQTLITTVIKQERGKGVAPTKDEPTIQVVVQTLALTERRATLDISARGVPTPSEPRTIADDSCKNGACVLRHVTIATGPVELLFLSLDLPVTKTSDLVYDSASGTLQPQTTPTVVFLGFDVAFGDILTKPRSVSWSNFVLKGFIKLSSRPSDAFGFGLGFRPPRMELGGIPLELFQVFGAYVWTKQDGVTATGAPESSSSYKSALRAGVSFNLDKLGDWLKL